MNGLVGAADDDARRFRRGVAPFRIFARLDRGVDGVEFTRGIFAEHHAGMGHLFRLRLVVGDDHRHAELGDAKQKLGEFLRQAHATMRRGIAGQLTRMQRDARPGEPVHVGHRRIVVGRGMVVLVLLQDLEHAGRRRVAELAGRAGRGGDAHPVAINIEPLVGKRDDDDDRPARRAVGIPVEFAVRELIGGLVDELRQRGTEPQGGCGGRDAAELTAVHSVSRPQPARIRE